MSFPPVGIHDLDLALPSPRLPMATLVAQRTAADPALAPHLARALATTGQEAMRFPAPGDDPVTLACDALAALADRRGPAWASALRFLVLGTETGVDMSKAGSSYVLGALQRAGYDLPSTLASFQVQQACAGGTLGLLTVAGFLQAAGRSEDTGVVLTSDIARYKAPSTAEVTQGAGATAVLLGQNPDLLELDLATVGLSSRDVDDFFRPLGSTIAKVKGSYSMQCYHQALAEAFADHCARAGVDPAEELRATDAFVLHAPYARMPQVALQTLVSSVLGLDEAGAAAYVADRGVPAAAAATAEIGNLYTGSLYLGLIYTLADRARAWGASASGRRVLLASYGSGNTMAVVRATTAPAFAATVARWNLEGHRASSREAPWDEYLAWLEGGSTPTPVRDRFTLVGIREDGYREYQR